MGGFCELAAARPSRRPPVDAGAGARASPGLRAAGVEKEPPSGWTEAERRLRREAWPCGAVSTGEMELAERVICLTPREKPRRRRMTRVAVSMQQRRIIPPKTPIVTATGRCQL